MVVSYGKVSATDKLNKYYLQIASDAAFTKDVVTIDGKLENSGAFDYTFTIPTPVKGRYFKLVYDIQQTGGNGTIQVDKVEYWQKAESGKTATTLSFKDLVGEGVTLINGKLANGDDFNGYTATEKDKVAGTIAYAASGDGVATVDANTGTVTVTPNVYGKTTITATFTPTKTEKYAGSTASYTITNIKSKYYETVADLRKDLNNGTLNANDEVAVKLTDAKVLYVNEWTAKGNEHTQYFVREGNAAISFYDTDSKMSKSAVVNGTFMGKIGSLTGLLVLTKNNNTNPADLQVKASTNPAEPIEISTDDIANYVCDLVTVKGATVIGGTVHFSTEITLCLYITINSFHGPRLWRHLMIMLM